MVLNPFFTRRPSSMKKLAILGLFVFLGGAWAEPYLAVRTGFKCSQCHVNRIGGGERTEYGSAYTQYKLLMTQTEEFTQAGAVTSFDPKLNSSITIGANFRAEETMLQKYSYRDTGTHVASTSSQLDIKEGNLYMNIELIKNRLNLYIDQGIAPAASGREMWAMVRNLPLNSYVKVGKTLLPYGLRLMDDQAFIRDKTGYTYSNPDLSGEIGLEPGPLSLTANLTNQRFSSVGSIVYRQFRVGGSYGTSIKAPHKYTFDTYGPFAGFNLGRVTFLGEVDFIEKAAAIDTAANIHQVAQFYEVDFLPIQGFNVKATYEYFDRNTDVGNKYDGQERWTFGVEPFVTRFLQLGVYYRLNAFVPQNLTENQDQIIGRAHVFF